MAWEVKLYFMVENIFWDFWYIWFSLQVSDVHQKENNHVTVLSSRRHVLHLCSVKCTKSSCWAYLCDELGTLKYQKKILLHLGDFKEIGAAISSNYVVIHCHWVKLLFLCNFKLQALLQTLTVERQQLCWKVWWDSRSYL